MNDSNLHKKGIGGHQSATSASDEYLTPPEIIQACGVFDLDPCAPTIRPWSMAKTHYTIEDNGLLRPWEGRVWCNPPYGRKMGAFLNLMCLHMNGIALIFARTETQDFHQYVWPVADSMLFIEGRIIFYDIYGNLATIKNPKAKNYGKIANSGAPSVLIAYGEQNADALADSGLKGKHIPVNSVPVITLSVDRTWKQVVSVSLHRIGRGAKLSEIYTDVSITSSEKVERNENYQAKVRQILQRYFTRVEKGVYSA